jgi:excisionase family DNA binding protein
MTTHEQTNRRERYNRARCYRAILPLVISPTDACGVLHCGIAEVYRLLNDGTLKSYKEGRARKIIFSSIEEHVARRLAEAGDTPAKSPARVPPRRKCRAASLSPTADDDATGHGGGAHAAVVRRTLTT